MLDIIQNNPYRLVGVFATSKRKEIMANIARIKANIRVNRQVTFPADLNEIIPSVERTIDSISDSESKLTLPKDLLRYALFWFVESSEIDKIAINNLSVGSIDKAISIWEKKDNLTSSHNRIIAYLVKGNYRNAIEAASLFYQRFSKEFAELILGAEAKIASSEELVHFFIDTLCDALGVSEVSLYITNKKWKEYVSGKVVTPLCETIEHCVNISKESKGKDSNARLIAGTKLMTDTLSPLRKLKNELSASNPKLQIIADKLGLEILQCGIDYYNGSDDNDAAYKAMRLQKYAQSVVIGKLAKDRCDENVRILEDIISKLPPMDVMCYHKEIQVKLHTFSIQPDKICCSIQLLKDCAPYIVAIKEKLGKTHQYYLKVSTSIVNNALGNIISEVNEAQESSDFTTLKAALIRAWRAQLYMDKYDLDTEYKEGRYKESRKALYGIIDNSKGFESSSMSFMYQHGCGWCNDLDVSDLDMRTDDELFVSCDTISSYAEYIERFPTGKHVSEAKSQIIELQFRNCKTMSDYHKFINDYPQSSYVSQARERLNTLVSQENARKARIASQEKSVNACSTTTEVVALYTKERSNLIDCEKCASKAYDLAKNEKDYRTVVSIFGTRSTGGRKAKAKIEEIERKRKEAEEKRRNIIKWYLWISIPIIALFVVYLIWGVYCLGSICYVFAFIFGFIALGSIASKEGKGCLVAIICGAIACGLGNLGEYFHNSSNKSSGSETEYIHSSDRNESKSDCSYSNDYTTSSESSSLNSYDNYSESVNSQQNIDYKTYIDNQLKTGSKPYKDYYKSRTGRNYLDFKTSENDYVIIVKDHTTSAVVNHIYVRANDKGRLYLPNGTYTIYFYGGKGWNPNMENRNVTGGFVSREHTLKDGPVELYDQYGEYTLYPVQDGNLQLQGASKEEAL